MKTSPISFCSWLLAIGYWLCAPAPAQATPVAYSSISITGGVLTNRIVVTPSDTAGFLSGKLAVAGSLTIATQTVSGAQRLVISNTPGGVDTNTVSLIVSNQLAAQADLSAGAGLEIVSMVSTNGSTNMAVGFDTNGAAVGKTNGVIFQNAKELKIVTAGEYKADWSMTVNNSASDRTVEGGVMVNATASLNTVNATRTKESGVDYSVGGSGIITLVSNDLVKLCIEEESGTGTVTVNHANLTIPRIDN
jgi:hypothetical protein